MVTFLRSVSALMILVGFLAASPSITAEQPHRDRGAPPSAPIDSVLQEAIDSGVKHARVIIRVDPRWRRSLKETVARRRWKMKSEHSIISALTVDVPVRALDGIARMPGVRSISSDAEVSVVADGTSPTAVDVTGTLLR